MSANKKLLFIEDRIPYTFLGAGFPRSRQLLVALTQMGYEITFYPTRQDEYPEYLHTFLNQFPNINIVTGDSYYKAGLKNYLGSHIGGFDQVLITRPKSMSYLSEFIREIRPNIPNTMIIYDAEAITSIREFQQKSLSGEIVDEVALRTQIEKELAPAKVADLIFTVSESERQAFIQSGFHESQVRILSHVTPVEDIGESFEGRKNLLFVGAMHNEVNPNSDSMLWFCRSILPLISDAEPSINLKIVGINKSLSVQQLQSDSVHILGKVDDLTDIYNSSRVFIAPTRFAAGIPLKVIEAAARGIPIVTTTLIAQQLSLTDQVLTADTEEEFALQVLKLYSNEQLWSEMRYKALEWVEIEFSESKFIHELQEGLMLSDESEMRLDINDFNENG